MKKTLMLVAITSALIASTVTALAFHGLGDHFPDVDENEFYADSVYRMNSLGVLTGYDNGNYGPDDTVTRGQLATALDRYDQALLDPPWPNKSGISDVLQLLCFGVDHNITDEGTQMAFDSVCDLP